MSDTSVSRPKALLVSSYGEWSGLVRVPAMFHRAGATLSLMAPANSVLRCSRFIDQTFTLPDALDALAPALREHLSAHDYDMIVLGDDPAVAAVAEAAAGDDGGWIDAWFPIDRARGLELIFCKSAFTRAADQHRLPIPRSRVCPSIADVPAAAEDVGYPLVVKTAVGMAGNGVVRVDRPADLPAAINSLRTRTPLVVQEFVAGKLGTTQMVLDRGRVLYWMPSHVILCYPEPYGPSCVRQFLRQGDLAAMKPIVDAVAEMTHFRGMCGIDWIQRPDGTFVLLEFNPRPTPAMEMGRFAGADCGLALRELLTGRPTPAMPASLKRPGEKIFLFPQHLHRCLHHREYGQLRHWLPLMSTRDIPWVEPHLIARDSWRLMRLAVRRLVQAVNPWYTQRTKKPDRQIAGLDDAETALPI